MSEIAKRITGMTDKELRECDFSTDTSKRIYVGVSAFRDIRIAGGLYITQEDLNEERKKLRKHTPKALRMYKGLIEKIF